MKNNLITSSIVLYKNEFELISKAIHSLFNTKVDVILFLIDNSPTKDLNLFTSNPRIHYIHNPLNPGFGASHNIAIRKSFEFNPDYHLVLNPDIYFHEGTLETILEFMNSNKEVGHLMPKILFPDNRLQYLCKTNPSFFDLFVRGFMPNFLNKIYKKRMDKYENREKNFDDLIYDIPYLSGCFMFFRFDILKKVGFFDENIFMYLEDADITRRFLQISKTVYYPKAIVYHLYGGLTHKKWKYKYITIKSAITYFNKWGWFNNLF